MDMEVTTIMKKATTLASIVALSLVVGACANTANDTKDTTPKSETSANKNKEATDMIKKVDGVAIEIIKAIKLDKAKKTDETILKIHFKGKNNGADSQPLDAMLLSVKNKQGQVLAVYPSTSLETSLKSSEEAEGDAFFVLKGDTPLTLIYENPDTKSKATWTIKTIKDAS